MSKANWHVSEDSLELYATGRMRDLDLENVEEHLLVCESCRNKLDGHETYIRSMKVALLRNREQPGSAWERLWQTLTLPTPRWVGAIAVVALIGFVTQIPRLTSTVGDAPVQVRLEAMKGNAETAIANRALALILDGRGLPPAPSYRLEISGSDGKIVWRANAIAESETLRGLVASPPGTGTYFVRVYGNKPELLREFSLLIR